MRGRHLDGLLARLTVRTVDTTTRVGAVEIVATARDGDNEVRALTGDHADAVLGRLAALSSRRTTRLELDGGAARLPDVVGGP